MTALPDLMTEEEAARVLHVSPRTLRSIRKRGAIRYIRTSPRKVFYTAEDCADYIESQRCQDAPPCPSTNPRKAGSTSTISSSKVIAFTDLLAAQASVTQSATKPKSGGRRH